MNALALPHLFQEELYRFTSPVVIVLPREWSTYSPEDQVLLKKILVSVKLDIHAVMILVRPKVVIADLGIYKPARVLIFGCEVPAEVPLYQQVAAQGFNVIRADDLPALDDQKKKNLWLALRQMFGV